MLLSFSSLLSAMCLMIHCTCFQWCFFHSSLLSLWSNDNIARKNILPQRLVWLLIHFSWFSCWLLLLLFSFFMRVSCRMLWIIVCPSCTSCCPPSTPPHHQFCFLHEKSPWTDSWKSLDKILHESAIKCYCYTTSLQFASSSSPVTSLPWE